MGWLFGKKKKEPKVPFPTAHAPDPNALRFPSSSAPKEKVIKPENVKKAVGFDKPLTFPTAKESKQEKEVPMPTTPPPAPKPMAAPPKTSFFSSSKPKEEQQDHFDFDAPREGPARFNAPAGPLFVKVDVYQRILGEIDELKGNLKQLTHATNSLEESEFNEEANFGKLRRSIKAVHDRLLAVDTTLFKSQGE